MPKFRIKGLKEGGKALPLKLNLKEVMELVRSYTEGKLGLKNSFKLLLDGEEYFEEEEERGVIDFEKQVIVLNSKGIEAGDYTKLYAASTYAYFQLLATLYEFTGERDKISKSKLLLGLCKKVEFKTGKYLEEKGLPFRYIEQDVMRNVREGSEAYDREVAEGFKIVESVQSMIPANCERKEHIFLNMALASTKYRRIDDGIRDMKRLAKTSVCEICTLAGFAAYRKPMDVAAVKELSDNLLKLIGSKAQAREILETFEEYLNALAKGGAPRDLQTDLKEAYKKLYESVDDYTPLDDYQAELVRKSIERVSKEYLKKVRARKEYICIPPF